MENVNEYFNQLAEFLRRNEWIVHHELTFRQIDEFEAYIKGELYLHGGLILHLAEYIRICDKLVTRPKYRYHLQDPRNRFVARWDNAPHHSEIPTFPYHKHFKEEKNIVPSAAVNLERVLSELDSVLSNE